MQRVNEVRLNMGYGYETLADRSGLSYSHVYNVCNGHKPMTERVQTLLAKAMKVNTAYIAKDYYKEVKEKEKANHAYMEATKLGGQNAAPLQQEPTTSPVSMLDWFMLIFIIVVFIVLIII